MPEKNTGASRVCPMELPERSRNKSRFVPQQEIKDGARLGKTTSTPATFRELLPVRDFLELIRAIPESHWSIISKLTVSVLC